MSFRLFVCTGLSLLLSACGFIAAPVTHSAAYAGKGAVLGADKGIEMSKEAAKVVAETAIVVGDAALEGLKPAPSQEPSSARGSLRPR